MLDDSKPVDNPILIQKLIDSCTRSVKQSRKSYDMSEGMPEEFREGAGDLLEMTESVLDAAMSIRTQGDVERCIAAVYACNAKADSLYKMIEQKRKDIAAA